MGKEEKNENKYIHRGLQNGSVARKESGGAVKGSDGQENKSVGRTKAYSVKEKSGIGLHQAEAGRKNQNVGEKDAGQQLYVRNESIRLQGCTGEGYGKQAEHTADIGEQIIQDFVSSGDMGRESEKYREIQEQSVSDFRSTTGIMERAGSAVVQAGRSVVSSAGDGEDAAFAGAKKIGNTAVSVFSVLAHSGANASYNRMRDQALTVADAADALDRAFAEGRVTMGMVEGNRNAVIRSLHQSGMSVPMAKKIARNLEEIRDKLVARAAVLDFGAKTGKLSADDIDFVRSRAFFDPVSFDKHYGRIAGACLRGSGSPLFEKVNPARFSVEDIDKRLRLDRAAERVRRKAAGGNNGNGEAGKSIKLSKTEEKLLRERPLSAGEKALLRELKRMKEGKRISAKGKPHHGIHKVGDMAVMGWRYLQRIDDPAVEGARQFVDLYRGGRGTVQVVCGSYQVGKKAVRFMGRGAVRLAQTRPVRFVGYRFKAAGRVMASAAKRTRPVQGVILAGRRGKAVAGNVRRSVGNVRQAAGRAVRGGQAGTGCFRQPGSSVIKRDGTGGERESAGYGKESQTDRRQCLPEIPEGGTENKEWGREGGQDSQKAH